MSPRGQRPGGAWRAVLPILVAAVAACDSPTIPAAAVAYDFTFKTDPPSVLRWPAGSTIRVHVAGGEDPVRAALLRDAFREAAAQWESAVLFEEYRFAEAVAVQEADVVLFWWGDPIPADTVGCPPDGVSRALTWSCPESVPGRLRPFLVNGEPSRIRMMVFVLRSEAGNPDAVRRVVLHELGHVLGIGDHSVDIADAMHGNAPVQQLSAADRATVQVLYHVAPDILP